MNKQTHPHHGHRKRALEGLMSAQGGSITDIQLLEFILFYCIERVDTNPIAHRLLDAFGGMKNVFDADEEDIARIQGMGPVSARKLKYISAFLEEYHLLSTRSSESDRRSVSSLHEMISEAIRLEILPKHPGAKYCLLSFDSSLVRSGSHSMNMDLAEWLHVLSIYKKKVDGERMILCANLKNSGSAIMQEIKTVGDDNLRAHGINTVAIILPDGTIQIFDI